jgi:hypothetical protein
MAQQKPVVKKTTKPKLGGEIGRPPFDKKSPVTYLPGRKATNVPKGKFGKTISKAQNGIEKTGAVKVTDSTKPSKVVYPGYRPPRVPTTAKSKYDTETIKKTFNQDGTVKKAKSGGSFPDLNKDGKVTRADILKGRGVIAKKGATIKKAKSGTKVKKAFLGSVLGGVGKSLLGGGGMGGMLGGLGLDKIMGSLGKKGLGTKTPSFDPVVSKSMKKGGKVSKSMKSGGSMKKCKGGC